MKAIALLVLAAAALAASACAHKHPEEAPRDYDGVKQRSERSHGSLDKEQAD